KKRSDKAALRAAYNGISRPLVFNAPELFSAKLVGVVGLPHLVEGSQEDDVVANLVENGIDGGYLIRLRWNSSTVCLSSMGPASLCSRLERVIGNDRNGTRQTYQ